jgi:hypothetical protein
MSRARRRRSGIVVHDGLAGERAPDAAIRAGRVQIVVKDEDGRRRSYGRLVARRQAGDYLVALTVDEARGMDWIIATDLDSRRQAIFGFRAGRGEAALDVFRGVTAAELDRRLDGALDVPPI